MTIEYDNFVDAKGLQCPQPLLLASQAIKKMLPNSVLLLEVTDPHTDLDLQVWCERFGHQIVHIEEKGDLFRFWIQKGN
ncbi:MAG TPA: sulfurtransferase TusA family protein [Gammaproteobacteria bacterium]|nr:sulfurtransferase TusA family protein [Xanthomonadales bacterium]MCB1594399.1 sulfurtransferase TusA family protein [Xanthomonadales bacterium]HOP22693.1 sulfurtransferase TusA family protein [Gammaproteobacteria bacterium]HPI96275.1 sulfurtransferase TusA family protein [Gammaproteobacteria bacterium]HPQ87753.1 sulfurtransferase TusA family protein [Gammaproteobacteria bacterium]